MKNLPCIIFLSALASLLLVTAAASLGVSFPLALVTSDIVGFSCAAGVLAIFLTDYAPRSSRSGAEPVRSTESKREIEPAAQAAVSRCSVVRRNEPFSDDSGTMATFGLRNDPATVSLM